MLAKHCTMQDLKAALAEINAQFDENICFRKLEASGKNIRFTLTVYDSRKAGGRLGVPNHFDSGKQTGRQRHLAAACWHVHGEFFDALFAIAPQAVIVSKGKKITAEAGNWQDRNIGSQVYPYMYSDACICQ